jgi:hypothetical protein
MQVLEINVCKSNMIDKDPEGERLRSSNTDKCCTSGAEERFPFA